MSPVLPASDPVNLSLAMSEVAEPVSSVSVTIGEDVDPPPLPHSFPPVSSVVVGGTAEHSKPVRNLLEVHLREERVLLVMVGSSLVFIYLP